MVNVANKSLWNCTSTHVYLYGMLLKHSYIFAFYDTLYLC